MLIRSAWKLTLAESAVLPRSYGLELVKNLHKRMNWPMGSEAIADISYSGILGSVAVSKEVLTFRAGEEYELILCGLQDSSAQAIAQLNLTPTINLLGATFEVSDRQDEITSYEELYTLRVANEPEADRQFNLEFLTPTAFAQQGTHLPLPVPTLMFRSWLERWNHFAPVYLGSDELIGYLSEAIVLRNHRIQTRSFQIHQSRISGFIGDITLQTRQRTDPLLVNVASLLLQYARFAGTGVKTRLGMGQTSVR